MPKISLHQYTQTDIPIPRIVSNPLPSVATQTELIMPIPRFSTGDSDRLQTELDYESQTALQETYDLIINKIKTQLYIGANTVEDHLQILAPAIRGIFRARLEKVFPNVSIRNYWESVSIHPTHPTHPNMLETSSPKQRVLDWLLR
jgi:hypothetical protein